MRNNRPDCAVWVRTHTHTADAQARREAWGTQDARARAARPCMCK